MTTARSAAKLMLDPELLREAEDMQIDVSKAAEAGIARAIVSERQARDWARENADVIESNNEYVRRNGLPLQKYRAR